jgi:TRAP-type C4-dicarboxylate transport system substrate-binding protein
VKKFVIISFIIMLVSSFVIAGCAPSAPAGQAKQLKYNDQNPETGWAATHAAHPYLMSIEDATNGGIKFTEYYAQSLSKGIDAWEAAKSGIADLSWSFHGYWGGMTTLADVVSLPFMPWKDSEHASGALWQLTEEFPAMAEQFNENKILITWTTSPYFLVTTKKQVKTLEDTKGMKLRLIGGPPTDWAKQIGISPMAVPMPGTYENLQKGVIDGMGTVWEAALTFKHYEVTKYWTLLPMYMGYFTMAMNWDVWNGLGPEMQKQVMSVSGLKGSKLYGKNMFDLVEKACRDKVKETGADVTYYDLPKKELARWQQSAGPIYEKWVADREAEGFSQARDILNRAKDLAGM